MLRLAVIGLGNRAAGIVEVMREVEPDVRLVAVADPDRRKVEQRLEKMGIDAAGVRDYSTADELLEQADDYDGVLIGTRCHRHTEMACKVACTGLPLYLEKPVSITGEQLRQLALAFEGREQNVQISFPLRATPLFSAAREIVVQGRLGTINQVQAINNVPYGGVYFGGWYRNYDEVGGLWLQKATHDFDYINHMLGVRPLMIAATTSQTIYGGDKPGDLRCSVCDEQDTCSESARNQEARGDNGGMAIDHSGESLGTDHWCPFSETIRNQDAGSALVQYEGGVHAVYTQNFVTRRSAGKRGAIITGHLGSIEFDLFTEKIRVVDHHGDRVDEISVKASSGHAGGDHVLASGFIAMMRGTGPPTADLRDGLLSIAMCLAARQSAYDRTFCPVVLPLESAAPLPTPATEVPVAGA